MQVSNTAMAATSDERQLKQIARRYVADYSDLLRTAEAFSREQYAVRGGSDTKALTDFFFPLSTL
jgi:hypothetical protein